MQFITDQGTPYLAGGADAHPERRLHEGLDLLAETWQADTGRFVHDGQLARVWIRRAIVISRGDLTPAGSMLTGLVSGTLFVYTECGNKCWSNR